MFKLAYKVLKSFIVIPVKMLSFFFAITPALAVVQEGWQNETQLVAYYQALRDDPNQVLRQLEDTSSLPVKGPSRAFIQLIKSQAHIALVYPEKAIISADEGVAILCPEYRSDLASVNKKDSLFPEECNQSNQGNQILYLRLLLSKASALDLKGNAREGVLIAEQVTNMAKNLDEAVYLESLVTYGLIQISLAKYISAYEMLLEAYQRAPDNLSKDHPWQSKGDIAGLLALVFEYRGEPEVAIRYFEEAVNHYRLLSQRLELSIALYGSARANNRLKNYHTAELQFQESLNLAREIKDQQGVAYSLQELGGVLIAQEKYEAAIDVLKQASDKFAESNNPYMLFGINLKLSHISILQDRLTDAELYFSKALTFLDSDNMPEHKLQALEHGANLAAANQQYEKAFRDLSEVSRQRREQNLQQSFSRLQDIYAEYLTSQQKKSMQLQQLALQRAEDQKRFMSIGIALLLVIAILLSLFLFRSFRYRQTLQQMAEVDGLTKLFNRRHIYHLLAQRFELMRRVKSPLAIALLDLDHFKQINDSFGHSVGDQVLKLFAEVARARLRQSDAIGRVGGEEFMVLLPNTDEKGAISLLESLLSDIRQISSKLDIATLNVSCSAGIGVLTPSECDDESHSVQTYIASYLKQIDQALYKAKALGRDRIETV